MRLVVSTLTHKLEMQTATIREQEQRIGSMHRAGKHKHTGTGEASTIVHFDETLTTDSTGGTLKNTAAINTSAIQQILEKASAREHAMHRLSQTLTAMKSSHASELLLLQSTHARQLGVTTHTVTNYTKEIEMVGSQQHH